MSRSGSRNFLQALGSHAQRVNAAPWPFQFGTVKSYDPSTHRAVVTVDYGDTSFDTSPCSIASEFWGQGYGSQAGPPQGAQVILGVLHPNGNEFIILGFTSNDQDTAFNIPSDDYEVKDKRGSFVNWTAARSGALRIFGAAVATIFGGTKTEVGGENLDATARAAITKTELDTAIATLVTHLQTQLTSWASANLPGGNGASGPTLTPTTSTGSSTVKIAP